MGKNFRSPSQATTTSLHSYADLTRREKFRQKTKSNFFSCLKFMYNKERKVYCNKSCKHWWLLILHYIIFLMILFGILFGALFLIMSHIKKTRTEALFSKTDLVADISPALGIFPRLRQQVTSLIWYTRKKPEKESVKPETYITAIDEFLKPYDDINPSLYVDCNVTQPKPHQYCLFTKNDLGPCGKDGYGYKNDKPCIYLKLNKLKGWRPEYTSKNENTKTKNSSGKVDITCNGITCFDNDHMGNISYYPGPFFKDYFFPFDGSPRYRSPLIGIQFENLNHGFVIGVKCFVKASTKNLQNKLLHTATAFLYIDVN